MRASDIKWYELTMHSRDQVKGTELHMCLWREQPYLQWPLFTWPLGNNCFVSSQRSPTSITWLWICIVSQTERNVEHKHIPAYVKCSLQKFIYFYFFLDKQKNENKLIRQLFVIIKIRIIIINYISKRRKSDTRI